MSVTQPTCASLVSQQKCLRKGEGAGSGLADRVSASLICLHWRRPGEGVWGRRRRGRRFNEEPIVDHGKWSGGKVVQAAIRCDEMRGVGVRRQRAGPGCVCVRACVFICVFTPLAQ